MRACSSFLHYVWWYGFLPPSFLLGCPAGHTLPPPSPHKKKTLTVFFS